MLPCVATIGVLDGVHIGHAALVRGAREIARRLSISRVVAFSFDPHPLAALNAKSTPARLTTWAQRERFLRAAGADEVVRLSPTPDLLALDPAEFLSQLIRDHALRAVVEGPDFRFGHKRAGDVRLLQWLGPRMGFETHVVSPVDAVLNDHTIVRVSSSLTRWLIENGRVADAAILLGRPYEIDAAVERGDRRGRTIGFPTANLKTDQLLPADAVYAAHAVLPSGRVVSAAVNVGKRPTFVDAPPTLEAHLLLDSGAIEGRASRAWSPVDGLPEYGWPLQLRFTHWLRDQARFSSLEALTAQLECDCRRVLDLHDADARTRSQARAQPGDVTASQTPHTPARSMTSNA